MSKDKEIARDSRRVASPQRTRALRLDSPVGLSGCTARELPAVNGLLIMRGVGVLSHGQGAA